MTIFIIKMENKLRQVIKKILKEEIELSGDKNEAKQALIAFSRNLIPNSNIKVTPELSSSDYEDGYNETDGIFIVKILFEGNTYEFDFNVTASFYTIGGYDGDFAGPIDTARAPEPQSLEDEQITIDSDEIIMYDQEQNEYIFSFEEFDKDFRIRIGKILTQYYNP